ncbi:MAG: aspartate aminotransferase, partial [Calditrichaeota bacterium]|nr:aspartate aminotransferase [Calditrichota bacterium]
MRVFKLERYFARYEFQAKYLLSSSDCESLSQAELLALAGDDTRRMWEELILGYTESQGHPLLREEIAKLYENTSAEDILVAVPEEGIFLAMNSFPG